VLSASGSLSELSLINIENKTLLPRLKSVFQRHRNMTKLELRACPDKQLEYLPSDETRGKETLSHYKSYSLNIEPQSFDCLQNLKELILENLKSLDLEQILQRLASLKLLDITSTELNDKTVEEFQKISKQRGPSNGFRIIVGVAIKRHEIQESGTAGFSGYNRKVYLNSKYAGKTWDPDQE
jgi:hypothetical protein